MLDYRTLSDIVTGLLIGIALLLVMLSRNEISGQERKYTLPASAIGGLGLCFLGASILSPSLLSPTLTLTGTVAGFREVGGIRSSHFEFSLNSGGHGSDILRAEYFDKGSFSGDSAVSDGDVVRASYLAWTSEVLDMTELTGRHTGWTYRKDDNGSGPWLLMVVGSVLCIRGIIGWFSDREAEPDPAEG